MNCLLSLPRSEPRYTGTRHDTRKSVGLDRAVPYDEVPVSTKSTPLIFFAVIGGSPEEKHKVSTFGELIPSA